MLRIQKSPDNFVEEESHPIFEKPVNKLSSLYDFKSRIAKSFFRRELFQARYQNMSDSRRLYANSSKEFPTASGTGGISYDVTERDALFHF